jgi:hypothetical protein
MILVTILCILCGVAAATGVFGMTATFAILSLIWCCEKAEHVPAVSIFRVALQCAWMAVLALSFQAAIFTTAIVWESTESTEYEYIVVGGVILLATLPVVFFATAIVVHIAYAIHEFITHQCPRMAGTMPTSRNCMRPWQSLPRHVLAAGIVWAMYTVASLWSAVPHVITDWTFALFAVLILVTFCCRICAASTGASRQINGSTTIQ